MIFTNLMHVMNVISFLHDISLKELQHVIVFVTIFTISQKGL